MFISLPKEARETAILSVRATSLIGILSLWNVAEMPYFIPFTLIYMLGFLLDIKKTYPVRRLLLNTLGVLLTIYFLSELSIEEPLKPFAHVVLLLMAIKSLEDKKPRDLYQILLLSLFALSISTVYNLSLSFLFIFLLHSVLGVIALFFINLYREANHLELTEELSKKYLIVGLIFSLLVFLLTLPFFFFLPRTQAPLFDLLSRGSGLKTGLTDSVSLGKVGDIQEDNTVVMRVYGLPAGIKEPYWRAVVFGTYINHTWLKVKEDNHILPQGRGDITYTVVLEPTFENIIPALDYPYSVLGVEGLRAEAYMTTGNVLRLSKEINRTVRLTLSSSKQLYMEEDPEEYLQVPKNISPSLKMLAEKLSSGAKDEEEKLRRVISHFSQGYAYTLKLERYEGDPIDYFLFVSKKGNCEYYATATALLLRLMGVPARVVGGYKGALWNAYGGYHIVTNSMAHVWVEAYIKGRWVRVDTTPPYLSPSLKNISSLALVRDAILSFWHSYVVGYSSEKQIRLFKNISGGIKREFSIDNLKRRLTQLSFLILSLTGLYLIYLQTKRLVKNPENLFMRTREVLFREGLIKDKRAFPEEVIEACKGTAYYEYVKFIAQLYQKSKYSPYRLYPDELEEGYRAFNKLKELLRSDRRYAHG